MHRKRLGLCTLPFSLCADRGGELFFKTLDLWPTGQPTRTQRCHDFIYFCFLKRGAKEWNLKFGHLLIKTASRCMRSKYRFDKQLSEPRRVIQAGSATP